MFQCLFNVRKFLFVWVKCRAGICNLQPQSLISPIRKNKTLICIYVIVLIRIHLKKKKSCFLKIKKKSPFFIKIWKFVNSDRGSVEVNRVLISWRDPKVYTSSFQTKRPAVTQDPLNATNVAMSCVMSALKGYFTIWGAYETVVVVFLNLMKIKSELIKWSLLHFCNVCLFKNRKFAP